MNEFSQFLLRVLLLLLLKVLYFPLRAYQYVVDSFCLVTSYSRTEPDNNSYNVLPTLKNGTISAIINADDIVEICHAHGYKVHEHVVQTKDGYLLAIHRVLKNSKDSHSKRPVVYFHHGLLTNSELFLLGDTKERCLPFLLLERGYDVWLGNNRGNKYSRKHLRLSATSSKFWDYSLDQFALYDIPNTIGYILSTTQQLDLTYVGFSQGSAQAFGALSLNPELNRKINLFIGLSPAMIPKGLNYPIVELFIQAAPSLIFSFFGQRAILPSVVFWQKMMGNDLYKRVVDKSLTILFDWKSSNISEAQKKVGYPHMFSPSSVKSVVHWFQIIKNRRFQMYDEGQESTLTKITSTNKKVHRVAPFPVQTISTPVLLIYGTNDMLIDIELTIDALSNSKSVKVIKVDGYEHMDVLWARDVESTVFKPVLNEIDSLKLPKDLSLEDSTEVSEAESLFV